jgi:hypothetical protein
MVRLYNMDILNGVGRSMPISDFLVGQRLEPETRRVVGVAWELARAALHVSDRGDATGAMLAAKILELAKTGEQNPDLLCERALDALRAGERVHASLRGVVAVWRPADVPSSR